jgi:hypothetical protein
VSRWRGRMRGGRGREWHGQTEQGAPASSSRVWLDDGQIWCSENGARTATRRDVDGRVAGDMRGQRPREKRRSIHVHNEGGRRVENTSC